MALRLRHLLLGVVCLTVACVAARPVGAGLMLLEGSLVMTRSDTGAIVWSRRMAIGDRASGSITITNSGALPGRYLLHGTAFGSPPLLRRLRLSILDSRGRPLYRGPVSRLRTVDLGPLRAGEALTISFRVRLASPGQDMDDTLQGLRAGFDVQWFAAQR